jgi:hypothetical protein
MVESDPWEAFPERDYLAEHQARWRRLAIASIICALVAAGLLAFALIVIGAS